MTLNYKIAGSGKRQIIFVHGNSQSLEFWDGVIASRALQNEYTLIAVDLPGHGNSFRSRNPEADYSLKGFASYLKLFLTQFEVTDYILVANSFGANVISEMETPFKNCKGIMLVGSTAFGKGLGAGDVIMPNPNLDICFKPEFTEEQLQLLVDDAAFNVPAGVKKKASAAFKNADPALRGMLGLSIASGDYSDELQSLEALELPIAVVYGGNEKICFTDALDKIKFPKWKNKIILIPESGHCCQLDQPVRLAELVKEFAGDCFR